MDCPKIPQLSYKDFSKNLHKKLKSDRPIDSTLELTMKCNLKCLHCYCAFKNRKELNTNQWKKIIDQIIDAGCLWVCFTGGEPLVRKDFVDIYLYAKKKGLLITLFSNGTLINEEIADMLKNYRPFSIEISLYGASKKIYESVTRVENSYERCIAAIDLLLERKLPLKLKTFVVKANHDELWAIKQIAKKRGLQFRFDAIVSPRLDGSLKPYDYRLSPEEVVNLDTQDSDRKREWIATAKSPIIKASDDRIFDCAAGQNSIHVNAQGRMQLCNFVSMPEYDLVKGKIFDGYRIVQKLFHDSPKTRKDCSGCQSIQYCNHCPGWGLLEKNDLYAKINYACTIGQLRALKFNKLLQTGG